ncbi:hypothetical protein H4582DRAFT_1979420 [Lactarius indigo]|nr:hypothetical protein H4582DRAFT_1979420 [Lactarius indigo]
MLTSHHLFVFFPSSYSLVALPCAGLIFHCRLPPHNGLFTFSPPYTSLLTFFDFIMLLATIRVLN